jgi:tetratricopeptide (TPR) repeat protein
MTLTWKLLLYSAFCALLGSFPAYAQDIKGGLMTGPLNAQPQPSMQPDLNLSQGDRPGTSVNLLTRFKLTEDEACLPWILSEIRGATVSVARLDVPGNARSEYNKACGDFKKQKLAEAEQHLRNAIDKYSDYAAAWVMLGEVLKAQQQEEKAQRACSRAEETDPSYLPPYLCLAELDAQGGKWDEIVNLTKIALGLNPVGDAYAYFYRSMAYFHLNQLPEAERDALEAEGINRGHQEAPVHYLLAQIYEAKKDIASASAELKEFLKINTDKQKSDEAKNYLAKLEGQASARQPAAQ